MNEWTVVGRFVMNHVPKLQNAMNTRMPAVYGTLSRLTTFGLRMNMRKDVGTDEKGSSGPCWGSMKNATQKKKLCCGPIDKRNSEVNLVVEN